MSEIVNKVKQSEKLVTIDLQKFYDETPATELDIKDFLHQGLILKEHEFRDKLEHHNWDQYAGKYLCVFCSTDAIISKWAFMLIAQHAVPFVKDVFMGKKEDILFELYRRNLDKIDWTRYQDKFVILKGCSGKDKPVPESVYLYTTNKLLPFVRKLMYGEACSNVPVYRS